MSKSNYAPSQLERLDGTGYTAETVQSLSGLAKGRVSDVNELKERIADFFAACQRTKLRPGIESLCLALGISRITFWTWLQGRGAGKDDEWRSVCVQAHQATVAFIEQAQLSGHLNPASSIFLLKNWAGYVDAPPVLNQTITENKPLPASQLPRLDERGIEHESAIK